MNARPRTVSLGWFFICLSALIWFALGLLIALDLHPALPDRPLYQAILAGLSLGCAGGLLGTFIFLRKRRRWAYLLAVGLLGVISLLFIFDQFGLADLIVLVINLVPLLLLIKDRNWYWQAEPRMGAGRAASA